MPTANSSVPLFARVTHFDYKLLRPIIIISLKSLKALLCTLSINWQMEEDQAMMEAPAQAEVDLASESGAAAGAGGVADALNLACGSEETTWV